MALNATSFLVNDDAISLNTSTLSDLPSTMFSRAASPSASSTAPSVKATRKRRQTATTTWEHAKRVKPDDIRLDKKGNKIWIYLYCD